MNNVDQVGIYSTINICAVLMPFAFTHVLDFCLACFIFLCFQRVFYRWFLMQLCNKYLLKTKRKGFFSLDKSKIQQLLNFFFFVDLCLHSAGERVWGNISSLFLVILRWRLCSSGISNLTSSPIRQNELFMEKNNPSVEFFFISSWFDFTWVKV